MAIPKITDNIYNLKIAKEGRGVVRSIRKKPWEQPDFADDLINIKRTKRANAVLQKRLYVSIGFFLSMLLVTLAFEWRSYDSSIKISLANNNQFTEEIFDIPVTKQPPPPPPMKVVKQPNIVEVQDVDDIKEEIKIDFDMDVSEDDAFAAMDIIKEEVPVEEKADEIFTIVEFKPTPKDGMASFFKMIYENINYPKAALRTKVQGKVYAQFVVNADGQLSDFVVIKGIGMGCDEEAIRVLKLSPPWEPGKQRGKPVRVRMILPIQFIFRERQ